MLWREIQRFGLERFNKEFTVCFCNTGKERNETLDFVHEVEMRWARGWDAVTKAHLSDSVEIEYTYKF